MALVVELVLQSGSLKGLAEVYGVSYPTIRARLDKVIARLREAIAGKPRDPVRELLADMVARGELGSGAARAIQATVDRQREQAGKERTA